MEKQVTTLPSIFKFSVLWNILPYYGCLHEWKDTLGSLWKRTSEIWDENKWEFMHWGRNLKKSIDNDYHSKITRKELKSIELFILNSRLHEMDIKTKEINLKNNCEAPRYWMMLLQKLKESFTIIF